MARFGRMFTSFAFAGILAAACSRPALTPAAAERAGAPQWSYEGARGPSHWGGTCATGTEQSPIDLPDPLVSRGPPPQLRYERVALALQNDGHTVRVGVPPGNLLVGGDDRFELYDVHLHSPAEHTVVGWMHEAELHFVHKSRDAVAVVAVFLESGRPNEALAPFFDHLPRMVTNEPVPVPGASIDLAALVPPNPKVLEYKGSLTTPPCTEDVTWFVVEQPLEASEEQIQKFRALMRGPNNRPVQPSNDRRVRLLSSRPGGSTGPVGESR